MKEIDIIMQRKDAQGNTEIHYPVTLTTNVIDSTTGKSIAGKLEQFPAENIRFADGTGLQDKLNAGDLKGANGVTYDWLTGASVPASGTGKAGDMYLNTASYDVYKKTSAAVWTLQCNIKGAAGVKGDAGATGANGVTYDWLTGTADPVADTGKAGDMYLNTATLDIFRKTSAAAWTKQSNIKGTIPDASETTKGLVQLATAEETAEGSAGGKVVTVSGLSAKIKTAIETDFKLNLVQRIYNEPGIHKFEVPSEGFYKVTVTGSGINSNVTASSASTATGTIFLNQGEEVYITIPPYPAEGTVYEVIGGTTSFGRYLSADGGIVGNYPPKVSGAVDVIVNGQAGIGGESTTYAGSYVRHSNYWGISGLKQLQDPVTPNKTVPNYLQATPLGKNIPHIIATLDTKSTGVSSFYKFSPDLSSHAVKNLSEASGAFTWCYYNANYIYFTAGNVIKIYNVTTGVLIATRTITSNIAFDGSARAISNVFLSYDSVNNILGIAAATVSYTVGSTQYVKVMLMEVNETISTTNITSSTVGDQASFQVTSYTDGNNYGTPSVSIGYPTALTITANFGYSEGSSGQNGLLVIFHGKTLVQKSFSSFYSMYSSGTSYTLYPNKFDHRKYMLYYRDYGYSYSDYKLTLTDAGKDTVLYSSQLSTEMNSIVTNSQLQAANKAVFVTGTTLWIYLGGTKYVQKSIQTGAVGATKIVNYIGDKYYFLNQVSSKDNTGFRIIGDLVSQSYEIEGVPKAMRIANPYGVNSFKGGTTDNFAGGGVCVVEYIAPVLEEATPKEPYKPLEIMSWAEISDIINDGKAAEMFEIGDRKTITLADDNQTALELLIHGINHDDLADGGKAAITFGVRICYGTAQFGASSSNQATYAWGGTNCKMYTWLRDTVFNALPDDLKPLVKNVNKYTSAGGTAELPALNTVSSKLFCFSEVEITGANTNSRVDEGQQYPIFSDSRYRRKGQSWWTRSPFKNNSSSIVYIDTSGNPYSNGAGANGTQGVCFGFCI